VESGSFWGDGIQTALDAGFKTIYSYEICNTNYNICRNRFANNSNINLYLKSSTKMFDEISQINEPITFWLDGHYSGLNTSYDEETFYPLKTELEIIAKHPIKTHTILIDDRRLLIETKENDPNSIGFSEQEIIKKLLEINPAYKIEFIDGAIENDVILAHC